jgi:hypothetical protein
MAQEARVEDADLIECKVAPWYYRRLGLMILVLVGCGCWFLYDGIVGWPKANMRADVYEAFQGGRDKEEWASLADEHGWDSQDLEEAVVADLKEAHQAGGTEVSWRDFAAQRRMPETPPEHHPQSAIDGQFHWAYGAFILAAGTAVVLLVNAPKKLRADREAFYTPSGTRVVFSTIFKVDKRKWDNKGLAYTHYRGESGDSGKAVIDDLKFDGAARILDRVLAGFDGELIERAPIDDEEDEEEIEGEGDEGAAGAQKTNSGPEGGSDEAATAGGRPGDPGA